MKKRVCVIVLVLFVFGLNTMLVADELLAKYEADHEQFERLEIGDLIVYFQQRMIGDAIVEKDFTVYQFDKATLELVDKKVRWRSGLPEQIVVNIDMAEAETKALGSVEYAELYIISPDSEVFPLNPTPENPCWVVRSVDLGDTVVTIVDAVNGKVLGVGVPPPQKKGFSLSGPQYNSPCSGTWTSWYQNAKSWFDTMGYPTTGVQWPTQSTVQSNIQDPAVALFYELAHGGSTSFASGCVGGVSYETTYASEVETWLTSHRKMPFTFIGSCGGMCETGDNTFSYEFRKGSSNFTTTVGYCGMAEPHCATCWGNSIGWQTALFTYMNQGDTVKTAFDKALADYPMCASDPACMRFEGDWNLRVVYDLCFDDGGWRKQFNTDGLWLVGEGWNTGCGTSGLVGWYYGDLFSMTWDIESDYPCTEAVFYMGHVSDRGFHWINTNGSRGTSALSPCASAASDDFVDEQAAGELLLPEHAAYAICLTDGFGYQHEFDIVDGYYLQGESQVGSCGTVPLIGAVEGNIFSWYVDIPTGTVGCNEGFTYAGMVSTLGGVWRSQAHGTGSFSLGPCAAGAEVPLVRPENTPAAPVKN